jgi:hypothetical protein
MNASTLLDSVARFYKYYDIDDLTLHFWVPLYTELKHYYKFKSIEELNWNESAVVTVTFKE